MDWSIILDYLLKGLGSAAATLIITLGTILFTKLKTKIGEARLNSFIENAVKAAEQLFPNLGQKTGTEKYNYVLNLIKSKYPKLSDSYLKPLIEGAVYTLSEQVRQIAKAKVEEESQTTTETKSLSSF